MKRTLRFIALTATVALSSWVPYADAAETMVKPKMCAAAQDLSAKNQEGNLGGLMVMAQAKGSEPWAAETRCVHKAIYYFEYPGGPECGLKYRYCSPPHYSEGCVTPYFEEYYFCGCP